MPNFLHGVEIQEIDAGTKVIKTAKSSVIGIIGTAPDANIPANVPILVTGSKVPETLGNAGTLPSAITSIFDQIGAVLVVVRVSEEVGENESVEDNVIAGLDAFLASESTIHVKPQILIAPGFSGDSEVLTAMIPVAEKLKAIIIADVGSSASSPNTTDTNAINYASEFGSSRVYMVDPWVKVGEVALPPSPFVAESEVDRSREPCNSKDFLIGW